MILGVGGYALFVEGAGLDPSTSDLLVLAPLAAIALWILLRGQLAADRSPVPASR